LKTEKKLTNYGTPSQAKDGSSSGYWGSAHLVEDKAGEPSICEETFIDITERQEG